MISESELESILNFELIEELSEFFDCLDQDTVIDSLVNFHEKSSALIEKSILENKNLWIGLSNYQNRPVIKVKFLEPTDSYSKLHELYRTDANILIGYCKFNSKTNSFEQSPKIHFFLESWEGNMVGEYSSKTVEENNFRYKKVS